MVATVVSTSILGLLATAFLTNEAWRLPASSAGLWLVGFIGRTKETTDGRFQRGRIMGYLQANPGCHFRALMSALDLSNGQTTHHLRVLEREEQIWRRKDGRLIRFTPSPVISTPASLKTSSRSPALHGPQLAAGSHPDHARR